MVLSQLLIKSVLSTLINRGVYARQMRVYCFLNFIGQFFSRIFFLKMVKHSQIRDDEFVLMMFGCLLNFYSSQSVASLYVSKDCTSS
jgi:hypothetical protein